MNIREFSAPACWFGPRMLRRWIWAERYHLSTDTIDAINGFLEDVDKDMSYINIDSTVRSAVLNMNYGQIIQCLEGEDFDKFVEDTKEYFMTDSNVINELSAKNNIRFTADTIFIFKNRRFPVLKQRLLKNFDGEVLQPRISFSHALRIIVQRSSRMQDTHTINLNESTQIDEAENIIRTGYYPAIEHIEKILDLLIDFSQKLLASCDSSYFQDEHQIKDEKTSHQKSSRLPDWGDKEEEMHRLSNRLLDIVINGNINNDFRHLSSEIEEFSGLCWGSLLKYRNNEQSLPRRRGELAVKFSELREHYRNLVAHPTTSLSSNSTLPRILVQTAQTIHKDIEMLVAILRRYGCFPELVRIRSFEESSKGFRLRGTAGPDTEEYQILYSDKYLVERMIPDLQNSIAHEDKDQDFWLFPASGSHWLFNPLLIPVGNQHDYEFAIPLLAHIPPPQTAEGKEASAEPEEPAP